MAFNDTEELGMDTKHNRTDEEDALIAATVAAEKARAMPEPPANQQAADGYDEWLNANGTKFEEAPERPESPEL